MTDMEKLPSSQEISIRMAQHTSLQAYVLQCHSVRPQLLMGGGAMAFAILAFQRGPQIFHLILGFASRQV